MSLLQILASSGRGKEEKREDNSRMREPRKRGKLSKRGYVKRRGKLGLKPLMQQTMYQMKWKRLLVSTIPSP